MQIRDLCNGCKQCASLSLNHSMCNKNHRCYASRSQGSVQHESLFNASIMKFLPMMFSSMGLVLHKKAGQADGDNNNNNEYNARFVFR